MISGALIPVGDNDAGIRRPGIVVTLLVLINIGVFIYELTLSDLQLALFVQRWGVVPYELVHLEDIPPLLGWPVLVTIFSAMFIHGGFLHIAGNMLFLWIFGDNIEDVMGHLKFLIFYLICGIAAAAAQTLTDTESLTPMIGASGAIAGVLGAYLRLFPRGMVRVATFFFFFPILFRLPAIVVIGLWFLIQLISGYALLGVTSAASGTAYFAHIGGFIAGLILVSLFADSRAVRRHQTLHRL